MGSSSLRFPVAAVAIASSLAAAAVVITVGDGVSPRLCDAIVKSHSGQRSVGVTVPADLLS